MHTVTQAIVDDNRGREAERLRIKFAALRADAFAFYRGTCGLFYRTLELDRALQASPAVLACGDLHTQNFGSYKGDNRLVYFDISDFDEGCVAPLAFDVLRFLTSLLVGSEALKISNKVSAELITEFLDTYAADLMAGKPRWVERALASGPVKALLQSVRGRHRRDLIKARTQRKAGKVRLIIDGKRTLAASAQNRAQAEAILTAYGRAQASADFFEPVDIARRIAGNGSLGLERYVALVRGNGGRDGQYLIDIKLGNASALAAHSRTRQPRWRDEAQRVATIQTITQAIAPALLGAIALGKRAYVIKELQPMADCVNLAALKGKSGTLKAAVRTMAEVTAWGHLRGCGRYGAAPVEALAEFAARAAWRRQISDGAQRAKHLVLQQWQAYAKDYDAGLLREKIKPH